MKLVIEKQGKEELLKRHYENPRHNPKVCPVCKASKK